MTLGVVHAIPTMLGASPISGQNFLPMRRLCAEVLEDAIRILVNGKHEVLRHPQTRLLHVKETLQWFLGSGKWGRVSDGYVFRFENVCFVLGLSPTAILEQIAREGLLDFKAANLAVMDKNGDVRVYHGRDTERVCPSNRNRSLRLCTT